MPETFQSLDGWKYSQPSQGSSSKRLSMDPMVQTGCVISLSGFIFWGWGSVCVILVLWEEKYSLYKNHFFLKPGILRDEKEQAISDSLPYFS